MFTWQTKKSMFKAILTKNSPFYIQFYVSKFCHLKCKMCNIVEANADVIPFDSDKIEKIANNLVKIGAGVVLLTGGEPFLRPDIDEIVRIFTEKKLNVRLQTAGIGKRKEAISKCVEYGAQDINISIDSLDENLSDYINGVKGSWQDAIEMIAYVSLVFPDNDSICALGCVLSPYNIDEIEAILDFATQIGWWLSLVPVHITTPDHPMNFRGYDEHFSFSKEDFPRVRSLIERLKSKKKQGFMLFDSDDYLDSIVEFVATGQPSWRYKGVCDSPHLYFAILPDGMFAPCCDHRFSEDIYVYDKNFPYIYRSAQFRQKVVNEVTQKCPGCNFGSYPEMSLTVRSLSTLKERVLLQFRVNSVNKKALSTEELLCIINEIRESYEIYWKPRDYNFRKQKKWLRVSNIPERLWNEQ